MIFSIGIINDKIDSLAGKARRVEDSLEVSADNYYLRVRVLDGNIFIETKGEFIFLPITVGGNKIRKLIEDMKLISIIIDSKEAGSQTARTRKIVNKLVAALFDDSESSLMELLKDKDNAQFLKVEAFSPEAIDRSKYRGMQVVYWKDIAREALKDKEEIVITGHQPGYHYYFGNFYKMKTADIFSLSDIFEFRKGNWQNRQLFYFDESGEKAWKTVPVKRDKEEMEPIRDITIDNDVSWKKEHWERIKKGYARYPYFERYASFFEELYSRDWESLNALNEAITRYIAAKLGIETLLIRASLMPENKKKGAGAIAELVVQSAGKEAIKSRKQKVIYLSS